MKILWAIVLLVSLGCQSTSHVWRTDLGDALAIAEAKDQPVLVISILGDLNRHC